MTNAVASIVAAALAFSPLSYHPDYRLSPSLAALEERAVIAGDYTLMSEWSHRAVITAIVPLPAPFLTLTGTYDAVIEDIGPYVTGYAITANSLLSYESTAHIGASLTFIRGLSMGVSFEQDIDVLANNFVYQPYLSAGIHYDIDTSFLRGTVAFGVMDIALARTPSFNMTAMAEYRPLPFIAVRYVFEKQADVLSHRLAAGAVFGGIGVNVSGVYDGTSFSVSGGIPLQIFANPDITVELTGRYHPLLGPEGGVSTVLRFGDMRTVDGFIAVSNGEAGGEYAVLEAKMRKMESTLTENERKIATLERERRERMLRRVTVLPFRNEGLRSYDYLKRTVVTTISGQLVKNAVLQAIPYDTVMEAFSKNGIAIERVGLTSETAAFIRDTFSSGFAVAGDITVIGKDVRITASLFAIEDGSVIDVFVENCAPGDKALFAALDVLGARIQVRLRSILSEKEKREARVP